jgi:hypothetical protein
MSRQTRAHVLATLFTLLLCRTLVANAEEDDVAAWPRQADADFGTIVFYQPQPESYADNVIEARAALSVTTKEQPQPVFGAVWLRARLATDLDERIVTLEQLQVTAAKFPDVSEEHVQRLTRFMEEEIPQWDVTFSLDQLLASLESIEGGEAREAELKSEPPEILFVTRPTVLVLIDGDPILGELENSDLDYVVNTAYYIVRDRGTKLYYLKGGPYWYTASDIMGSWKPTQQLPNSVAEIAKQIEEEEKKQAAEQEEAPEPQEEDAEVPDIVVRTGDAELVLTDGEMEMAPIQGTQLLYVQNTETDILMDISTQQYFILVSGRWYTSSSLGGSNWTHVPPDQVPADFAKIPAESDMGQVLVSVAGTEEAQEALLENSIPQTAEIDRKTATVTVTYDGDPQFETCGDGVAYAINTDKSVLLIGGRYYCCDDAVWFVANGPDGPWQVADSVPPEVQDIPPECPVYNVRYVYIYDSTPEVVYVGYTPGYAGSYVYHGCVVYGTGWWYHPWYHHYYYPRPRTYGFRVHYNPVTGWGFSFGVSFGWLHIRVGRPWYGGWWGPRGYRHGYRHGYRRGYRHGYHRGARAGYRAGYKAGKRSAHSNMYRNRPQGVRHTGGTRAAAQPRKQPRATGGKNNVYADRNGNVHRNQGGQWQQQQGKGGSWSQSQSPSKNVQRDHSSRQRGNQKASQNRSTRGRSGGGGRRR